jgi:hypothetical protein
VEGKCQELVFDTQLEKSKDTDIRRPTNVSKDIPSTASRGAELLYINGRLCKRSKNTYPATTK